MKKISLFLFSILMMFITISNVDAAGVIGDGNGGNPIYGVESDTSNWYPGIGNFKVRVGIRVSFVDKDGKDLKTNDYILVEAANSGNLTQYASGHSKTHYARNFSSINFTTAHPYLNIQHGTGSLVEAFNRHNFRLSISSYVTAPWDNNGNVQNVTYAYRVNLAKDWFSKDKFLGNDSDYADSLIGLLRDLVGNVYTIEDEEDLKGLFMVVEPTTTVYLEGISQPGFYYGTAYELAKISYERAIEPNFPNGTYGTHGLTSFATALGRNIPCSSTLDGSIYSTMQGLDVSIPGFSSTKYFNSIKIESGICGGTQPLNASKLTGDYGVGMAVVWFYGLIPEKETPDCADVDRLLGITSDPLCSDVYSLVTRFNNYYAEANGFKKIEPGWYKSQCGCRDNPTPGVYNCTPQNDVYQCTDGFSTSVHYSDSEDWENCIFNDNGYYDIDVHKTAANTALSYRENALGNRYCEVYCREELEASFDSNTYTVMAGSNFVWPKTANVNGSRTCKTKEIKFQQYLNDVLTANKAVRDAWGAYRTNVEKNKATGRSSAGYMSNYGGCPCLYNVGRTCCAAGYYTDDTCTRQVCTYNPETESDDCSIETYDCPKWVCTQESDHYGLYPSESYRVNISSPLGNYRDSGSVGGCANSYTPRYESESTAGYESAKFNADSIAKSMRECYTWANSTVYSVADTKVEILYEDITYSYNDLLDKTDPNYNSSADSSTCTSYNTNVLQCGGDSCTYYTVPVLKCEYYSKEVKAEQDFSLPDGVFQYVLKGTGGLSNFSIHYHDYVNYGNVNYIDIGYSNLPVSYGTPTGRNPISLYYSNMGHNSSINGISKLDIILGDAHYENYGKWECEYNVIDELIVRRKLNVIYRTIDLSNPFPDIDGQGRMTGSNWCDGTNCSNTNNVVDNVILKKQDIFSQEPMYSFTLTPSLIKQIRKYNKNTGYDDFNLKCESATGEACISSFLSDLIGNRLNGTSYSSQASGTCVSSSVRVPRADTFYGCRQYPNR